MNSVLSGLQRYRGPKRGTLAGKQKLYCSALARRSLTRELEKLCKRLVSGEFAGSSGRDILMFIVDVDRVNGCCRDYADFIYTFCRFGIGRRPNNAGEI